MKCLLCFRIACKRGYCNSCYTVSLKNGSIKRKFEKDISLSLIQKEFITGALLGDAWISNLKYGRKSPSFGIDRKQDDLNYLKWQYNFVNNLCSRPIVLKNKLNKTTQKTHKHCLFETRCLPSLLELRKLWYPNDIKIVPPTLELTRLIMQVWYCDDGSLEEMSSGNYRIRFSSHGFTKSDNEFLISLLEKRYGKGFSLNKDGDHYKISATVAISPIIINDLKIDFPTEIMERKFI